MRIIHKIDDFLHTIFPNIKDENNIINILESFYSYGSHKPKVKIENGFVIVDIDITKIASQENDFKKVITFCENGKFAEAKPLLQSLVKQNPTNSECHRIIGQIHSDEGDQDEAINSLIDALRWDSKNAYALVMMGNIFAKFKNDIETAMKYYDQALIAKPDDNITINNIGANLLQQNKFGEAKKYFHKALSLDKKYPNTHYALALIADKEGDLDLSFNSFIQTAKCSNKNDFFYKKGIEGAYQVANKIFEENNGEKVFKKYRVYLEEKGGVEIDLIKDVSIPTPAKIEFAENYDREKHIIKFKDTVPAYEHLIMHELVHLDFVLDAKKEENNLLFTSTQQHKNLFLKSIEPSLSKLKQRGISNEGIDTYGSSLFDGVNSQIFNAPIDLFIENNLYNKFTDLRPYQFVSLLNLVQDGLKAVTDEKVLELTPKDVVSKTKIYNLVGAFQIKDLFAIDFISEYNATKIELDTANKFYQEYQEYKEDRKPAEEYELVQHWAEDLKLSEYFELIGENQYRKRSNIDDFIDDLEKDPFGTDEKDPIKEKKMEAFLENQKEIGLNMAVVMFMVGAQEFFEGKSKEDIKTIAFEIAMQGTQGYDPNVKNYKLSVIPNKTFSGYQMLAYYYVSWAIAIPEMLSQLQLPFDNEYKLALTMYRAK
ncbi:tetratricopeptide repeat protein [Flavobacterium frigoris]|uniref:Tetratricopeptide repeat-containing protein n=1 Tax=Flavobacterium frigoris TaxID=229204 RepID=A0A1H9HWZ6_FLAFI|nr:tetratricopeptide repeat protein [Flavobacterium frigoris]SEQ66752.1 Tetratricopeptide repeat-containing protein [Flavobacterium frigoris]